MIKVKIQAKPGSKKPGIDKSNPDLWIVRVKEPPTEGKANKAIIKAVAKEFGVPQSRVRLVHGESGKQKLLEIDN
jgi:uncharacterized protein (TIGR00251 family)